MLRNIKGGALLLSNLMEGVIVLSAIVVLLGQAAVAVPSSSVPANHVAPQVQVGGITDSQRLKVREMQRDYWQAEAQFFAAKATAEALLREVQQIFQTMQATCKPPQQFDQEAIQCKERQSPPAPATSSKAPAQEEPREGSK